MNRPVGVPNERKPRLLVLASTYPRWKDDPEPAFVHELARRLVDAFDVLVLAPRAPGADGREVMDGVEIVRFPYFHRRWEVLAAQGGGILARLRASPLHYLLVPWFLAGQCLALARILRSRRIDVIHAHWIIPQGLCAVLVGWLRRGSPPIVCTSHGGDLYALRSRPLRWLKQRILSRCAAVTVVSTAMREVVLELGVVPARVSVASMGVDLGHRFTPPEKAGERDPDRLLFVGRIVEKKGLEVLLEAMPSILARRPSARLCVVGSGPLLEPMRARASALGIDGQVEFPGMLPQGRLPALYRGAAVVVAPFLVAASGDQEGLGLVLVEALGCTCPVVASDLPAVRDVIRDGETGWLVAPGDAGVLADAVVRVLSDPQGAARVASRGRERCRQRFDWPDVAARYASVLVQQIDPAVQGGGCGGEPGAPGRP